MTASQFRRTGNLVPTRNQPLQSDPNAPLSAISIANVTANAGLGTLPANGFPLYLLLRETAGHAVNIALGTTLGGSDVLAAQAVPASGTLTAAITAFSLGWFSATATQPLFLTSASWNGAIINASLIYQVGP